MKGSLLSIVFPLGTEVYMVHPNDNKKKNDNNKNNNNPISAQTPISTLAAIIIIIIIIIMAASSMVPAAATTAAATTTQSSSPPPPVTAATDNGSVNVVINWDPGEIDPNQDIEFTFDFQDPSSGESISHVNYNFEIIDENGETVQSMTELHTHSGSDVQTITFDTTGRFNLVVTIIGTGIDPPFDTTQSGTAQAAITVGQQVPAGADAAAAAADASGSGDSNNTTTTPISNNTITTNTTTTSSSPSGIELSRQPVFQEHVSPVSQTPINQTHIQITFSGNGTMNLPNGTETITTTSIGNGILAPRTGTLVGKEKILMMGEEEEGDGSENATATFYGIVRLDMQEGTGRGIAIAVFHTNSTGTLAPLNGMIMAGQEQILPDGSALSTYWEWQSGIPYIENPSDLTQESQMEATTTANTTATASSEPSPSAAP
jgi:hypothetical protein